MAIRRFSHVGICVSELERSLAFYRDALGFREAHRFEVAGEAPATLLGLPDVEVEAVFLERDGVRIELLCYRAPTCCGDGAPRPMHALGLTHLSLRVDDLAGTITALEQAGARVLHETRTWNSDRASGAVFAVDPDGTRIELIQSSTF